MNNSKLLLNQEDMKNVSTKQLNFLKLIHPFLDEHIYHNECIELRPIKRQENLLSCKSLNLWSISEKSLVYYDNFLKKINGLPMCLYYSVFTLDYNKKCFNSEGKLFQKGRINNQNALYTQILVMDFDDITNDQYEQQKEILKKLGINTISIFTGHGYQDIILLNEKTYDTNILKNFTNLLLKKGFSVDSSIIDSARVMRLPYTFNCKAFDSKSKYFSADPEPIKVEILNSTEKRYSLKEIFTKISTIPNKTEKKQVNKTLFIQKNNLQKNTILLNDFENYYPMLKTYEIPDAIKKMLMMTKEGLRNKALLFLVPYLRNHLQFDIPLIKEILSIWGTNCIPKLDSQFVKKEVERLLTYNFNSKIGKYDESLKNEFGILDFGDKDQYKTNAGNIIVSNKIFDLYPILSDCSLKIYYLMKVQNNLKNKSCWTADEIVDIAKISLPTFYRNITYLTKSSLVLKTEPDKKKGQPTTYSLLDLDLSKGYTFFNTSTIENMVFNENKKLTDGEIKLFTYLYFSTGNNRETWKSQDTIGKAIGKKRNSVSEMTKNLNKKEYLKKEFFIGEDNKPHNRYIINYSFSSSSSSSVYY